MTLGGGLHTVREARGGVEIPQSSSVACVCVCVFSQVRVWEIPEGGLRRNMTEAVLELYGHSRRVGLIEWHPTSSGILFSAGYDYKVPAKVKPSQRTSALLVKPLRPEAG